MMNAKTLLIGAFALLLSLALANADDYVSGTVYEADWVTPIDGVNVSLYNFADGSYANSSLTVGGNYNISVPAGLYNLTASKPGYITYPDSGPLSSTGGMSSPADFTLSPSAPGNLSGFVFAQNGSAIGNANVTISGYETKSALSDDTTGAYAINSITAPGTYDISVSAPNYLTYSATSAIYVAPNSSTTNWNIVLQINPANGTLTGLVRGGGSILDTANVTITQFGSTIAVYPAANYSISLAPGQYNATASSPGYDSQSVTVDIVAGENYTQDFNLVPATLASITVSPSTAPLTSGGTQPFIAAGYSTLNEQMLINPTWSVSGGIGSASPSTGTTTTFTASSTGSGTVVATVGAISGSANITVSAGGGGGGDTGGGILTSGGSFSTFVGVIRAGEENVTNETPQPPAPAPPAPASLATSVQSPDSAAVGTTVQLLALAADGMPAPNTVIDVLMPNQQKFSVVTDSDGRAVLYLDTEGVYTFALPASGIEAAGSINARKPEAPTPAAPATPAPTTPAPPVTVDTGAGRGPADLLTAALGNVLSSAKNAVTSNVQILAPLAAVIAIAVVGVLAFLAKGVLLGKPPAEPALKPKNGISKLAESMKTDKSIVEKWHASKKKAGKAG